MLFRSKEARTPRPWPQLRQPQRVRRSHRWPPPCTARRGPYRQMPRAKIRPQRRTRRRNNRPVSHSANSSRQSLSVLVHGLAGEPVVQWRARGGLRGFQPRPGTSCGQRKTALPITHHRVAGRALFLCLVMQRRGQSLVGVTAPKMQCSR